MTSGPAVAVAGISQTEQGDHSDRVQAEMWWQTVEAACHDAGLALSDIDGLIGDGPSGVGLRSHLPAAGVAEQLGRPLHFHACSETGAGRTLSGVTLAAHAIATGLATVVVMANVVAGRGPGYASADRGESVAALAKLSGPYEYVLGTTRVSDYAVYAMRHFEEFGTTSAQLAEVAVAQRHAATLHPLSLNGHRGELTIDEVLASPLIADPLRRLDCCVINQGGGAIVFTSVEHARGIAGRRPVALLGYGEGHSHIDPSAVDSFTANPAAKHAASRAFEQAGIERSDIDVAGIADHFSIGVLLGLEDAGFCGRGEGGAFVEHGGTGLGGHLPTNTSGGFLSFSHAGFSSIFSLIEVVEQLRGSAGPRQIAGAEFGYVSGVGGAQQAHCAAILGAI